MKRGTQLTCCTGSKVQILTQLHTCYCVWKQKLECLSKQVLSFLLLLYWHKSTNTDRNRPAGRCRRLSSSSRSEYRGPFRYRVHVYWASRLGRQYWLLQTYLLYCYKSTNTDASCCAAESSPTTTVLTSTTVLGFLVLVQKHKYWRKLLSCRELPDYRSPLLVLQCLVF